MQIKQHFHVSEKCFSVHKPSLLKPNPIEYFESTINKCCLTDPGRL
jgi:hypothetical protein